MIVIAERGTGAAHHRLLESWRYGEVAIHLLALHSCPRLGIVGIVLRHMERGRSGNSAHYTARGGGIISIDDAHRQLHHLSAAKNGGHKQQQEQGQHHRRPQIDAPRGHATPFTEKGASPLPLPRRSDSCSAEIFIYHLPCFLLFSDAGSPLSLGEGWGEASISAVIPGLKPSTGVSGRMRISNVRMS